MVYNAHSTEYLLYCIKKLGNILRQKKVDVLVVGAGPAGSSVAYELAKKGVEVIVLEEHQDIGLPCHCAGLVSLRTLEIAKTTIDEFGISIHNRARVWGPLGNSSWLNSNRTQAVTIDRTAFDKYLAERAEKAGANLRLGVRAKSFERIPNGIRVGMENGKKNGYLNASIIIGADGAKSKVARWLGVGSMQNVVPALKADIAFKGNGPEAIEIFVGNNIAPGWFGWIIPLGSGISRIGLIGIGREGRKKLKNLYNLIQEKFGEYEIVSQSGWLIPTDPLSEISFDNSLLIGDAARQSKPTSGGGIFMGIRAGQVASDAVIKSLELGDLSYSSLSEYRTMWEANEGEEIRYHHWLRSIFTRLTDPEIDALVGLCNKRWAKKLISKWGDIDYASWLFRPLQKVIENASPRFIKGLSQRLGENPNYENSLAYEIGELQIEVDSIPEKGAS